MPKYNPYTNTTDEPIIEDFMIPGKTMQDYMMMPGGGLQMLRNQYSVAYGIWAAKHNIPQSVLDEWYKIAYSQLPQVEKDKFWQNLKDRANEVKGTIVSTVNQVKGKAEDILKNGQEKALLVLFAPFTIVAKTFLKSRGVAPASDPKVLVRQVFDNMPKRGFGFDAPAAGTGGAGAGGEGGSNFTITPDMVTVVIQFLNTIFKSIKEKKANGEKLSDDEQKIMNAADQIENAIKEAKEEALNIEKDSESEASAVKGFDWKIVIGVLLLLLLFIFLIRK